MIARQLADGATQQATSIAGAAQSLATLEASRTPLAATVTLARSALKPRTPLWPDVEQGRFALDAFSARVPTPYLLRSRGYPAAARSPRALLAIGEVRDL